MTLAATSGLACAGGATEPRGSVTALQSKAQSMIAPYGTWTSPITAEMVAEGGLRLELVRISGDAIYWTENQPEQKARRTIVKWTAERGRAEILPPGFSARTRVHEGGGGEFWVEDETVYFANDADQRLYRMRPDQAPEPLTATTGFRYADGIVDGLRRRVIVVREDHSRPDAEARNELVAIGLDPPHAVTVLATGHDFYAAPRLSPDGSHLSFLSWDHPRMPWDGTELWVAAVADDGASQPAVRIAGGPDESVFQPQWSPDGRLYFVSDRTGWWNLYRLTSEPESWQSGSIASESVAARAVEYGRPQWSFSKSTYGFTSADEIVASYAHEGTYHLTRIDTRTQAITPISLPYTFYGGITVAGDTIAFIGGSATAAESVVTLTGPERKVRVLRDQSRTDLDARYLSEPRQVTFPTAGGAQAHAVFYPPTNPDYRAKEADKPPLLVVGHGGPTSMSPVILRMRFQYWTSRGFAILDVNYRGSTGYGRPYRTSLYGKWGIYEVEDCVHGARYLAEQGLVDPARMVMRGGSAGGFSTLNALAFHDVFKAGGVYYGVSDLALLFRSTHKFESRYLEQLIGPYPEAEAVYRARSALFHTEKLDEPVIFFHGAKDRVVPIDQAELMVERLRARGIDVEFLAFPDEYHGFQHSATIVASLGAELRFYRRVLDLKSAQVAGQ